MRNLVVKMADISSASTIFSVYAVSLKSLNLVRAINSDIKVINNKSSKLVSHKTQNINLQDNLSCVHMSVIPSAIVYQGS